MKLALIITVFLLAGCVSQPKQALLKDQYAWTELSCSGFKSWQDCNAEALNACPDGFYIKNELGNWLIQRRVVEVACKA